MNKKYINSRKYYSKYNIIISDPGDLIQYHLNNINVKSSNKCIQKYIINLFLMIINIKNERINPLD